MPSLRFETLRWWSVTATLAASDGDRLVRLHFAHPCWQADRFASASDGCPDPPVLIAVPEIFGVLRPDWKCQRQHDEQDSKKSIHKPPHRDCAP